MQNRSAGAAQLQSKRRSMKHLIFSIVECRCAGHGSVHTTCWLTSIFSWQGIGSQAFLRPARAFCLQPFAANSPKAQHYDQVVLLFYGVQMLDALKNKLPLHARRLKQHAHRLLEAHGS